MEKKVDWLEILVIAVRDEVIKGKDNPTEVEITLIDYPYTEIQAALFQHSKFEAFTKSCIKASINGITFRVLMVDGIQVTLLNRKTTSESIIRALAER